MKKIVTSIALGFSLVLAGCQQGAEPETNEDETEVRSSPAVWVASDGDSRLFLLGSVPMVKADAFWNTPAVTLAANQAKTFFVETDPSESGTMRAMMLTQELGFYSDGSKLSDSLDDNGKKLLSLASQRSEIAQGSFENVKPWFASLLLSVAAGEGAELLDDTMTPALIKDAEIKGAAIETLITPEQAIRGLADLSPDMQLKYLDRTLSDFSGLGDKMLQTAGAWQTGDIAALKINLTNMQTQLPSSAYQTLIKSRNNIYVGKLVEFLEGRGDGLAIVELPHLVDPGNLQVMLRERGYKVERYYGVD